VQAIREDNSNRSRLSGEVRSGKHRQMSRRRILFALGASEAVRLSGWAAPLRLSQPSAAAPTALAALVREVERETELVPGVRRVTVLERSQTRVRYEVRGLTCGLPWAVRFRKEWERDSRFEWRAEGGAGWPEQRGVLWLQPQGGGTLLELRAWTRSRLPLLGGLATLLVNPLFLAPTFSAWLRNLARVAEAEENYRAAPGSP
jgi:hypothetical protein